MSIENDNTMEVFFPSSWDWKQMNEVMEKNNWRPITWTLRPHYPKGIRDTMQDEIIWSIKIWYR